MPDRLRSPSASATFGVRDEPGVTVVQDDQTGSVTSARRSARGVAYIMNSARLDAITAERILDVLVERTGRPADAVADDLVQGRGFPGRPSWL